MHKKKRVMITSSGYSLKPFDDKKAIFVHIPKCAGVSINKMFFGNLAGGHATLNDYTVIFEPKCINEYFKFTIVRNPWDRLVSAYFFLKSGGLNHEDRRFFEKELSQFNSFDDFVINWLTVDNIKKYHHFKPQLHYISEANEKVNLDFIGRLENIHNDLNYICKRLNFNKTLPLLNKSNHTNYKDYYNQKTIKIVQDVYGKDIDFLGYNFENT